MDPPCKADGHLSSVAISMQCKGMTGIYTKGESKIEMVPYMMQYVVRTNKATHLDMTMFISLFQ